MRKVLHPLQCVQQMISCLVYYHQPFMIVTSLSLTTLFLVSSWCHSFIEPGASYISERLLSRESAQATYNIYIRMTVIVSADFIEGKNRTKPTHRWFLLYPIIHVFTPQELCSRISSTGYSGWIHHFVLLRGRVIDAACEGYGEYTGYLRMNFTDVLISRCWDGFAGADYGFLRSRRTLCWNLLSKGKSIDPPLPPRYKNTFFILQNWLLLNTFFYFTILIYYLKIISFKLHNFTKLINIFQQKCFLGLFLSLIGTKLKLNLIDFKLDLSYESIIIDLPLV